MADAEISTYSQGLLDEAHVITLLRQVYPGKDVVKSTPEDDVLNDIDVWINDTPMSIKTQHACSTTGNVCFELEVFMADGGSMPSWFYHTKSRYFVVFIGVCLYLVSIYRLRRYVELKGFVEVKTLTRQTQQSQATLQHKHINALIGLLPLSTLIREDIARLLYEKKTHTI